MGGVLLAINPGNAMFATKTYQSRQRDLGGIRNTGKHGFAEYRTAQRNAVQTAQQYTIAPDFHTVRKTGHIQAGVCTDHFRQNPRSGLATARCAGTSLYNSRKCAIKPYFAACVMDKPDQGPAQGAVQAELGNLQDHARIGAPPENGLVFAKPRKNAVAVSTLQRGNLKICADSQQTRNIDLHCLGQDDGAVGMPESA